MREGEIHAIITDPPYGLEFMGSEWDAPWKYRIAEYGYTDGCERRPGPSFQSGRNPICTICGKRQRTWQDGPPACSCEEPAFDEAKSSDMQKFQEWCILWLRECFRVLKPGGVIKVFGGTRTKHRMEAAVEAAGFQLVEEVAWLQGQGFPKSLSLSKALERHFSTRSSCDIDSKDFAEWGTALKPSWEPFVVALKPLENIS